MTTDVVGSANALLSRDVVGMHGLRTRLEAKVILRGGQGVRRED